VRLHGCYEGIQYQEATTGPGKRALQMVSLRGVYGPAFGKSISLGSCDTRVQIALRDSEMIYVLLRMTKNEIPLCDDTKTLQARPSIAVRL
jgi:hypothetical protein